MQPPPAHDEALEQRTREIGRELFSRARALAPSVLNPRWWDEHVMQWSMSSAGLKGRLFRLVDVLPALPDRAAVLEHLAEYLGDGRPPAGASPSHGRQPADGRRRAARAAGVQRSVGDLLHLVPPLLGSSRSLRGRLSAAAVLRAVRRLARRFIAGETPEQAVQTILALRRQHTAFSLDLLGEKVLSEREADAYAQTYLDLIDALTAAAGGWPSDPLLDAADSARALPRVNLSIKLSGLYSQFDPLKPRRSADAVLARLRPILRRARRRGAFIHVDTEHFAVRDLTLSLFAQAAGDDEFADWRDLGVVIQAYLRDSDRDLDRMLALGRRRGAPFTVRLVKGAYWDFENVLAAQHGWPVPVFAQKYQTDANFERLTRRLLAAGDELDPAIASHNVRSLAHAAAVAERLALPAGRLEFQLLYGMGDSIRAVLIERDARVRVYAPFGALIPGMAYLIRRLLENTSNESFLRQGFVEHADAERLLADPARIASAPPGPAPPDAATRDPARGDSADSDSASPDAGQRDSVQFGSAARDSAQPDSASINPARRARAPCAPAPPDSAPRDSTLPASAHRDPAPPVAGQRDPAKQDSAHRHPAPPDPRGDGGAAPGAGELPLAARTPAPFANAPDSDFAREDMRMRMHDAIERVRARLGEEFMLHIGGQRMPGRRVVLREDPADPAQTVARIHYAAPDHPDRAVAAADAAQPDWARTPVADRAALLNRLAELIEADRHDLAAWEVFETAKQWPEADADVSEAVDYCRYYAAQAVALMDQPVRRDVPGEQNLYRRLPRGVGAVIAPWNFPLAILAGMSTAAVATGNAVVLKPAEQSSAVAGRFIELVEQAGFPPGVFNYLPGAGEEAGARLVDHPGVDFVAFTGSRQVGLAIHARAAARPGRRGPRHVVCEMGGKNAIIIDADADLDDAVRGVVVPAFGYNGQKCSACSRAIVVGHAYDRFVERLAEAARSLTIGPPADSENFMGPLIDRAAVEKVRGYIEVGRSEGRCVLETDVSSLGPGYYVGPTVFADVAPDARIAREEIFGPVLAVIRADDFDHAIRIANGTDFALTGGVYTRSPAHAARARAELAVGNLYVNRRITGALVDRQPFGGFRYSGLGSKAGGPDYLLQFVLGQTITENTLRHGYAPEAGGDVG